MEGAYEESSPLFSTVKKVAQFNRIHTTLENNRREGRPKTATTNHNIRKVYGYIWIPHLLNANQIQTRK